ncbi:DUF7504 family protein [Halosegnis marinus]|uniref:DUF7504 family protein n=1 Tax=Halosegnis marinus TaxID=3034023 RepID=UPI00361B7EB4
MRATDGRQRGRPSPRRRHDRAGGCVPDRFLDGDAPTVRYETATRSAAVAPSGTGDLPAASDRVRDLAALGDAVAGLVDDAERAAGGLAPAQFRLCVDSLRPLVEEYDERELFRFLHAVTADVRAARGMAHYHLPLGYDAETARTLAPLFDAVVEVRDGDSGPRQRWHLDDAGVGTEWLPL